MHVLGVIPCKYHEKNRMGEEVLILEHPMRSNVFNSPMQKKSSMRNKYIKKINSYLEKQLVEISVLSCERNFCFFRRGF